MSSGHNKDGGLRTIEKVPLKGLFSDGVWHCNCDPRLPAAHFQTKNGSKNHGRWFYTCQKPQPRRCNFFLWDDQAKLREESAVLNNSRSEPRPDPQTPKKVANVTFTTPTSADRTPSNTEIRTPVAPSKSSPALDSSVGTLINDTQGNNELFEWPESDDDELSKMADQTSAIITMPPPETPRKATKTDPLSTPSKRRFDEMNHGAESAWPTPATDKSDDVFTTPVTGIRGRNLFSGSALMSPAETPTPLRTRNLLLEGSELAGEILDHLRTAQVSLRDDAAEVIKGICNKYALKLQGVTKGRDISRIAIKAKDERIAELQGRITALEAERETSRSVIRHLRSDMLAARPGRSKK